MSAQPYERHLRFATRAVRAPVVLVSAAEASGLPVWSPDDPSLTDDAVIVARRIVAPVTGDGGHALGALCAGDETPRAWTVSDLVTLWHAADAVASEMALRHALTAAEAARATAEAEYRSVIDSIGEVVFRTDAEGRWTMLTAPWAEVTGGAVADALGRSFLEYVHPEDRDAEQRAFESLTSRECGPVHHVVRYRAADGSCRWLEARVRLTTDDRGRPTGTFGTLNDVTARHRDRAARLDSEARLRLALDVAGLIVWEGPPGEPPPAGATPSDAPAYGLAAFVDRVHPDDRAQVEEALARALARGEDLSCECRLVLPGRAAFWAHTVARVLRDEHGHGTRLVGVSMDVSARREAEAARARKHSLLEATLEATGDGILVVDLDGRVAGYNQRLLSMWGLRDEGYAGERLAPLLGRVVPQLADPALARRRLPAPNGDAPPDTADRVELVDGRVYERTSRPQWLGGAVIGRVWTFRDVTARALLEARLAHQAYHDALTGLANRAQFRARMERALAHAAHGGRAADNVAVLLLDLDGFKRVNDAAGHAAGDELLRRVAERLLAATRGSDLVARLGGDEFGVLLERVRGDEDVVVVAERITSALQAPFTVLGSTAAVSVSIGAARGTGADAAPGQPSPVDAVLRKADLALYEAKARGKGRHALYDPSLHAAALERVALEAALRRAIAGNELRLAFQPVIELGSGRPVGLEALVRWEHPERGLMMPAQFISLAEETGLIIPLGAWVLREACRRGARWASGSGAAALTIAVNVSGLQLEQPTFVDDVASALAESGLPPACLLLELTESTVVEYPAVALARLTALKALGVGLAVDDFGTGYSALSHLQQFPFDVLKIDKRFVDHVAERGQDVALASAIVALGDALSLRTVAEGVETAEQHAALTAIGCGYGQGYYFARPLSEAEVDALLAGERAGGACPATR